MAILTLRYIVESAFGLIEGGDPAAAASISWGDLKASAAAIINKFLKTEYLTINAKIGETIQNGTVLGLYENIDVVQYGGGRSKSTLPAKPLNLPRNMGVFSVFLMSDPSKEFIPLQMGQANLLKSQPMINDLLGQIGFEVFGNEVVYTKDLTQLFQGEKVAMRLAILDPSQYGEYDPLPLPPEYEWDIINELVKVYSQQPTPDKISDATSDELKAIPINQQKQSS